MWHATGKIEIVGKTVSPIFMQYHQSADIANIGKLMVFLSNPLARWFDDHRYTLTDFEPKETLLFKIVQCIWSRSHLPLSFFTVRISKAFYYCTRRDLRIYKARPPIQFSWHQ